MPVPASKFLFQIRSRRESRGLDQHGIQRPDRQIFAFALVGKNLVLRTSANGTVMRICSVDKKNFGELKHNGKTYPIHMVLKLYARVPEKDLENVRKLRAYNRLVKAARDPDPDPAYRQLTEAIHGS